ncbi:MAG: LptF/LptG family permease [Flavobacteriales bacterium]|nr:LptF/LptG family permease [Flavobacteriales bacterium]
MKQIDLYIIRKFLVTFLYAIGLIILVVIVFDISEKLDDFIESDAPVMAIVMDYYLNFVPFFVNLFSSLFTFIAVIFFTSKMASNSEIVAILSSGMSFNRLLVPYMVAAAIITCMSLYLNNFVIPIANKGRLEFEETYIRHKFRNLDRNIHRQIEPNTFIYFERYDNINNIGFKFAIERFENNQLKYKLLSDTIRWDSTMQRWHISNYRIRLLDGTDETLVSGNGIDTVINFHPKDFGTRVNTVETMNYFQLANYIAIEKSKGSEKTTFYEIEHHKRFSVPFATFILTLIGVSLASRKVRGGIGIHLAVGLLVSFAYILFMQVSLTFATNANLAPMLALWIPNILFGFLALYLYRLAPK